MRLIQPLRKEFVLRVTAAAGTIITSAWTRSRDLRQGNAVLWSVIAMITIFGGYLVMHSHAASPAIAVEPEFGTYSGTGTADMYFDQSASKGLYVKFGNDVLPAPINLQAVTGGPSIALIWEPTMADGQGVSYEVYRNGTKLATTTPPTSTGPLVYTHGTRYNDTAVTAGTTYTYQVRAVDNRGQTSPMTSPISVTAPANTTPVPTITTDSSAAPDMAQWLNTVVVPELKIWYPKIADRLAYPNYTAPSSIKVILKTGMANPAVTYWDQGEIDASVEWFRAHPDDLGGFMHESTHIIQKYPNDNASFWIQEGLADWSREYLYQDRPGTQPTGSYDSYTSGYSEGSYLLQYIQQHTSASFLKDLNTTLHNNSYNPGYIGSKTSRSPDSWWTQMTGHAIRTGTIRSSAASNMCLDDESSGKASGTTAETYYCNGTSAQFWSVLPQGNGTNVIKVFSLCLDDYFSGTADGNPVNNWSCSGSTAQLWMINSNKTIQNVASGKCLYSNGGALTQATIRTCNANDTGQQWSTP